jgi:hypothetical protein
VKALFDRAAYGCRLYCCWCAQDIEANRFWESLGFVPLAFRTGSRDKERIHIFWQKRIREGDETTPWWFPSKTSSGSIREDRLVFPIPPGTHWSDVMPMVLPGEELPVDSDKLPVKKRRREREQKVGTIGIGAMVFAKDAKKDREERPRQKMKNNPQHERMARELRDRWLERVNSDATALLSAGKYDLRRVLQEMQMEMPQLPASPPKLLEAA